MFDKVLESAFQEARELGCRHLTRCHSKLAMLNLAGIANMTIDRYVIGRICKDHHSLFAGHKIRDVLSIQRIATDQSVLAQYPDVPPSHPWGDFIGQGVLFSQPFPCFLKPRDWRGIFACFPSVAVWYF